MRPQFYISTKCQADLWPFIQGHSFGLPHTYLNIFSSEITGLFDGNWKTIDQLNLNILLFCWQRFECQNLGCFKFWTFIHVLWMLFWALMQLCISVAWGPEEGTRDFEAAERKGMEREKITERKGMEMEKITERKRERRKEKREIRKEKTEGWRKGGERRTETGREGEQYNEKIAAWIVLGPIWGLISAPLQLKNLQKFSKMVLIIANFLVLHFGENFMKIQTE